MPKIPANTVGAYRIRPHVGENEMMYLPNKSSFLNEQV